MPLADVLHLQVDVGFVWLALSVQVQCGLYFVRDSGLGYALKISIRIIWLVVDGYLEL